MKSEEMCAASAVDMWKKVKPPPGLEGARTSTSELFTV
jgi:hypothetical protein